MASCAVLTPILPPPEDLYERDFIAWTERMAYLLQSRDASGLDWEHLAEEIRDLGLSFKHALKSHLEILLIHLIKWEIQPERRTRSWESSISNARVEIDSLMDSIPSLRRHLSEIFAHCYKRAYTRAIAETRLPALTPYTMWAAEKVLDPGFLPE